MRQRDKPPHGDAAAPLCMTPYPRTITACIQCSVQHSAPLLGHNAAAVQSLKNNAEGAVKDLKLNMNYITKFGQVALSEAVDMVYELGGGRMTTVHF